MVARCVFEGCGDVIDVSHGHTSSPWLQGGEAADEEEEEEEDDEYEDAPEQTLQSETSSVAGTKRGREEDEEDAGKISGDYGEFQEAEEGVAKRARHAADNATAEAEADEDEEEEV